MTQHSEFSDVSRKNKNCTVDEDDFHGLKQNSSQFEKLGRQKKLRVSASNI